MASDNLNFTNITNNRPGYAIPITFISLFILIPVISAFVNKIKDLKSVDVEYNNKFALLVSILLVVLLFIIALFVEFSNCIKYDIQMKIGERLVELCGGSQYYQRESPDELIASMIYKKNTDPVNVEGSPLRGNIIINNILNLIYYLLFLLYSIILLNRTLLLVLESEPSVIGKSPLIPTSFYKRFMATSGNNRIITVILLIIIVGYIVLYSLASISENTKIGKIPKDAGKKLKKMNLLKYSVLKVGVIGLTGFLLWGAQKSGLGQSKVASSEFMQDWNNSHILKILFAFIFILAILVYSYKASYEKLPSVVKEYMVKCDTLNSQISRLLTLPNIGNRLKNLLYKNIMDIDPTMNDSIAAAITNRADTLYQYIKHNNGRELIQLENGISRDNLQAIRSSMKDLRNYRNLKDTFKSYNRQVFAIFGVFVIIVFYLIFNYNYKINKSQVTVLTVISIVILIIITTIFGWFSNAVLMN